MALDLEEQEQVAELKAWWNQYGTLVVAVLAGALIALGGWQGWRWYQSRQAQAASLLFDALTHGAQTGDAKAVRDAAGALLENYPGSLYAAMGALGSARFHFDRGDLKTAKAQLGWAVASARSEDFRDLARLRLAGVLLDEKAYDEAIKLLDAPHGAALDAQYGALRGDILVAKGQAAEARAAYRAALDKAEKNQDNGAFRETLRMRLEALGG
ncbi:MAG TPA: tetratricopeptide repeat protein [Burkholderiales bacterium]